MSHFTRTASGLLFALALCSCSGNKPETVEPPDPAPEAAANLYVYDLSATAIDLRWRDLSDDEDGFRVERRTGAEGGFATLDTVGANEPRFEDIEVQEGQIYSYRVLAYRGSSSASPSNEATVRAEPNAAPSTPTSPSPDNGAVEIHPDSSLTLAWSSSDPDGEPVTFDVYFGTIRNALPRVAEAQAGTTWPVTGPLVRNQHYFWNVIARDPKGVSRPSPIWGFNTVVDRQSIPFGLFAMGDATTFFHPGSPVTVSEFNIDRFEVNNQQYADFLNQARDQDLLRVTSGSVYDRTGDSLWIELRSDDTDSEIVFQLADSVFLVVEGRESFPVVEVSWSGANAYARHYGRRLPTEAEWEKAARGIDTDLGVIFSSDSTEVGIGFPYPWGSTPDIARGNFENSGDPFENQGRVRTTPVGFYDGSNRGGYATLPGESPFGVQDMSGNVWEWCDDWFGPYRSPHFPPPTGDHKIIRGGSFLKFIGSSRTSNRSSLSPDQTDRSIGFRTAASGLLQR